ncbi:MAG: sigma-70 family RNA polymerase sigma factor [Aureliella sp.]
MQTNDAELEYQAGLRRLSDPQTQAALQTDAELLELYLYGGSHEAMVTLVQRFAPLVATVVRRVVSHPQDAEDAFQATFVILLKSAKSIRSRRSIAAWLYGVAYRTACRVRAKSRRRAVPLGDIDMPDLDSAENPIAQISRQIELSTLDRELENLPESLREPVVEHYILGHSARQIADRLELSVAAVEGRLRRGRRLLRHRLATRGLSLTVLASGIAWQRDHATTAMASEAWAERVLQNTPSNSSDSSLPLDSLLSSDPYISQLVQGEMAMRLAPLVKPIAMVSSVAFVTISLSLFALSAQIGGTQPREVRPSGSTPERVSAPAGPAEIDAAKIATASILSQSEPAQTPKLQPAGEPKMAAGPVMENVNVTSKEEVASFLRPEGESPSWLRTGTEDLQAGEKTRQRTRETVEVDFTGTPLSQVLDTFADMLAVDIVVDRQSLNDAEIDADTPITLQLHSLPLCEALEHILDPLGLAYEVNDYSIRVVSREQVQGSVRYYDLAYLLPTSAGIRDLVRTIQSTIEPDAWEIKGTGTGTIGLIGSMMVVNCPERAHRKIEKLLAELAKMNPANLRSATGPATATEGGLMGWGGGMGGGMGGMSGGGSSGGFFAVPDRPTKRPPVE